MVGIPKPAHSGVELRKKNMTLEEFIDALNENIENIELTGNLAVNRKQLTS
jgi:hypothetical protein